MYPSTPPAAPAGPSIPARIGTALWRVAVAACAFWGVFLIAYHPMLGWHDLWFLSQSGSLIAAVCYAVMALVPLIPGGTRIEPGLAWLRGALASMMLLICVASIFILGSGDLDQTGFLFEHLVTPLVIAFDFAIVGRAQSRARFWQPLTWVAIPLAYLIAANVAGEAAMLYGGILDPVNPQFGMYIGLFMATAVIFGYALFGVAKLRGLITKPAPQPLNPAFAPGAPAPVAGYPTPLVAGYPGQSGGYGPQGNPDVPGPNAGQQPNPYG